MKKSLAAVNKKLKKNKKERNKNISRRNNIKKEIEKLKVSSQPQRPISAPRRNRLSSQPRPVPAPRRPQLQHISHRTNQRFRSYIDEYRVLIEFGDLVSIFLRAFEFAIEANGLVD